MSSPSKKAPIHDRTHTHHKESKPETPKKGGAGGKGTWGVEGSELNAAAVTDVNDPNYDSAEDDGFVPRAPQPLDSFKKAVATILTEYFASGDAEEVMRQLNEIGRPEYHHEFVKSAISKSFDLHDRERELTSELLSRLYPNIISHEKIMDGFTVLLERIEDLQLDIPNAAEYLSMFLARAVADDLLPPSFLSADNADVEKAKDILVEAKSRIQGKGAHKRLAHVWGAGGDQKVKSFKERAQSILDEYLSSSDAAEADKAIRELNVPVFHWHIIKKAVLLAIGAKDSDREKLAKLLSDWHKSQLVSEDHFVAGFKACAESIDDIALDTPNARDTLTKFVQRSISAGYLPASFESVCSESMAKKK